MFFKDIVGQENTIRQLIANVQDNRISHARLFAGAEGSGHLPLTLALSTYIHCSRREASDACGTCPSCLKMRKLEHPDLHFFFPVATNSEHKKDPVSRLFYPNWRSLILKRPYFSYNQWLEAIGIENKQAIINAEDCNEIIRLLGLKSFESPYKIVIIYMVEKLYHAAAPKLLKILEEPPDNTLFLMITENKDMVLNTILSRAQIMRIPRPNHAAIVSYLEAGHSVSHDEAIHLANLSEGNICEALTMVDTPSDSFGFFEQFRSWMRLCYTKDIQNMLNWVEVVSRYGRERQKAFLTYCLNLFRMCLANNYDVPGLMNIQGEERSFIGKFSPFITHGNILQIVEMFHQSIYHVERNANPRILLADLSFQLAKLLKPS